MISATYRFRQAIAKNLIHRAGLLLISGMFLATATLAQANNIIPIVNGDFEAQTIPASPGFIVAVITGWTNAGGDGVFINSVSGMPNPAGGTNGAFINPSDTIYQNIGKVLDNNTYTVNFSVGTDGGTGFPSTINVELLSGVGATPTTLLGSSSGTASVATHVYDPFSVTFPFTTTGHAGENLFLEFVGGSASRFLDNVSASVTPEPSSLLLAALATAGLAVAGWRRRKCRVDGRSLGGQTAGLRKNLWKLGVVLAFVAIGSFAGASTAQATLISQYTLGEDGLTTPPVDTTGNHNFINSNGNATLDTSTHAPVAGSTASLAFTGSQGYYYVQPYPSPYSISNNFIVDIWAKASSTAIGDSRLLSTDGIGSAGIGSLQLGVTGFRYTADVINGVSGTVFATGPTVTTAWTELTLTDFGGTTTFYVNGVAQGSTSLAVDVGGQMHLGVAPGGGSFSGNLDQLTVTTVPEPSSMLLWALGAIGLFIAVRRRKA